MFLWEILQRDTKEELISKIYHTQKLIANKGDWYLIIQEDRLKYGIEESDLQISQMSQYRYRKLVEKKVHKNC